MAIGLPRVFVVHDDGRLEKWSWAKFERVYDGRELMPGVRRIKYAHILVDVEGRRVVDVWRMDFGYLRFDEKGKHKRDERLRLAMSAFARGDEEAPAKRVVDATKRFAQRSHKWTPSPWLKNKIFEAAFR